MHRKMVMVDWAKNCLFSSGMSSIRIVEQLYRLSHSACRNMNNSIFQVMKNANFYLNKILLLKTQYMYVECVLSLYKLRKIKPVISYGTNNILASYEMPSKFSDWCEP